MQFEDGSQIELLDAAARVVVDEVTPERVSVRLLTGRIRVDVVRRPERAFRVECGAVSVSVLGTAFELTRDRERTLVSVLRGRVAVDAPDGSVQLSAGEAGWFPRSVPRAPSPAPRKAAKPAATPSEPRWQAQAKRGDYKRAFELMPSAPEALADDVEALLLAADAARLSGHPAQALPYLRRVIERHPHDSRASLAAFTLGGVLLNQLDRPREADAAYARARSLALSSALAQDALARQVEAAQRAGDLARMRELASEYLRRYPDGRRFQWVRDTSGL
jgi:transmembrane sensor